MRTDCEHLITGQQFIGQSRSRTGSEIFRAIDPTTGKQLAGDFHEATQDEIDAAVIQADAAFDEFRARSPAQRAELLNEIARQVAALGEQLAQRTAAETGLSAPRIEIERTRTIGQAKLFAEVIRDGSWVNARIDHASNVDGAMTNVDLRNMLMPIGPVAVFGASNFPLAISVVGNDTISAFAAGCPVIVKAHPGHPGTCELLALAIHRAIEETKMPPGIFSMVQGASHQIGRQLVNHPLICAVGFTGSLAGGRALFDVAMRRAEPIPFYAEMGSSNPVFLLPSAGSTAGSNSNKVDSIARGFVHSMTNSCGQMCTKPGLVIGHKDTLEEFVECSRRLISESAAQTMLHPGIFESFQTGIAKLALHSSVQLIAKSATRNEHSKHAAAPAIFQSSYQSFLDDPKLQEEIFGPVSLFVQTENTHSLVDIAKSLRGSLTATIHGGEAELLENRELISILERKAGRLIFNGFPTGVAVAHAMHHGGPYPATTDPRVTSIGTASINRWARPICYQQFPQSAIPIELHDSNEAGIMRLVDGKFLK